MRSIARLLSAFGTLADSLLSLATVVDTATDRLRLQLAGETPALPHNGEVLDPATDQSGSPRAKRGRKN